MKTHFSILSVLTLGIVSAQNAVHNFGYIQMHENAQVGFHIDLTNDGVFYENQGLVGFYNAVDPLTISGTSIPAFYDAEILVDEGLYVDVGLGILNNANFISGNVFTPRTDPLVYMNFTNQAFYTGPSDPYKIEGYAGITNKEEFVFPVGDMTRIRPLTIKSIAINAVASCAYFNEDPNIASTFSQGFNTERKANRDLTVSTVEFWDLKSTIPSWVTLTWDSNSNLSSFVDQLEDIRVMGWNKYTDQWVDLGNTELTGDLNSGSVTSVEFVPFDYEILSLGGNKGDSEPGAISLDSYILSPNADGVNDTLIIENLQLSPNNNLKIYNRYGVLVYEMENYNNQFDGKSNVDMVYQRPDGLAAGVYFYIIQLKDLNQVHQGYMYITN